MDYQFLSGFDTSYSKCIRAHVLRRHLQERRLRAKKVRLPKTSSSEDEEDKVVISQDVKRFGRLCTFEFNPMQGAAEPRPDQEFTSILGYQPDRPSPLGQGSSDPFFTSALQSTITPTESLLIDYYCGDILVPWGITKGSSKLHPPRDICMSINLADKACLHACLSYTADTISRRGGGPYYSWLSTKHRVETIQLVKERVERQNFRPDDYTLQAVMGLISSVSENRLGVYPVSDDDEQEMHRHLQGLRAMIAARGGISPKLYGPRIYWLLHWIDLCLNGNVFPQPTISSRVLEARDYISFPVVTSNSVSPAISEDLIQAYEDFYHAAKARSLASLSTVPGNEKPQVPAWLLLLIQQSAAFYRKVFSAPADYVRPVAILLYLNIIFWHYQNADDGSDPEKLAQIHQIIRQVSIATTTTSAFWCLTTAPDSQRIHHPWSAWLLNRLMRIESRLSPRLQKQFKMTLMQFLLTDEIETFESSWLSPDQFRWEVTTDLNLEK